MKNNFLTLHRKIIRRGLCTGCGTCVAVCPKGALEFDFDAEAPVLSGSCGGCGICNATCPGGDIPLGKLEKRFLGESRTERNEILGVSKSFLKGFAKDAEIRGSGASGGLTTALLLYAMEKGLITGAVVTAMDRSKPWRAIPYLARTREELIGASKSKYVICPNNMALKDAREDDRLAIVGLPCHIHGIRKIQSNRALSMLAERIVLTVGLFCGSNWSYEITEHLIQEYSDVNHEEIERFEYRGGRDCQDVTISTRDGRVVTITNAERRMLFQCTEKDRCRMCCDWTAELADLSLGDIFDPELPRGSRKVPNWNACIVRTERGEDLIEAARRDETIEVSPLEEESFYQNLGYELKKQGALHTWKERKRYGWPTPDYHYDFSWRPKKKACSGLPISLKSQ